MAVRTVRLDDEAEAVLREVVELGGLTVSEALKRGIVELRSKLEQSPPRSAYDVYSALDLGPGGYAIAPSTQSRRGVREALERKHRR